MGRKKKCDITYSQAVDKLQTEKPKTRLSTRIYFWLFILFTVFSLFIFYLTRRIEDKTLYFIIAIVSVLMAAFFALIVFIRFIRSRSITGGLFLTTCISTGVFLGTSQVIPIVVPPTAAAFTSNPDVTNNGFQLLVALAQVGLFAIWFAFLLFTIYLYVQPVKRIDKYLGKIMEGDDIKKVKIGSASQYKVIEEKIKFLIDSRTHCESIHSSIQADETSKS